MHLSTDDARPAVPESPEGAYPAPDMSTAGTGIRAGHDHDPGLDEPDAWDDDDEDEDEERPPIPRWPRVLSALVVALAVFLAQPGFIASLLPGIAEAAASATCSPEVLASRVGVLALWAGALALAVLSARLLHAGGTNSHRLGDAARASVALAPVATAFLAAAIAIAPSLPGDAAPSAAALSMLPVTFALPLICAVMSGARALRGSRGYITIRRSFAPFAIAVALLACAALAALPAVMPAAAHVWL